MRGDNEILDFDSNNISNILWKLYIIIHLYSYVKVLLKNEHTANKFCVHLNFNFLKYFSFYFRNMNKC